MKTKLPFTRVVEEAKVPAPLPAPAPTPSLPPCRGLAVERSRVEGAEYWRLVLITSDGKGPPTYEYLGEAEPKAWAHERWAIESVRRIFAEGTDAT